MSKGNDDNKNKSNVCGEALSIQINSATWHTRQWMTFRQPNR